MSSQLFQDRPASSWTEAKRLLAKYGQSQLFRGQANAEWLLRTSLERCSFFAKSYHVERDVLEDFQRAAVSYQEIRHLPAKDDYVSWLAIMQHYGAPTRLLDFTESPFVASYFALENATENCAVWTIDERDLKSDLHHKWRFEFHDEMNFELKPSVFKEIFEENKLECIFPVRPPLSNRRYLLQQSIFLCLGNSNQTFMQHLAAYPYPEGFPQHFHKIVIPIQARDEALWDLNRMNINRSTLFGDLEAYTAYLKRHYELRYDGAPHKVWNAENPDGE